MTPSRSRFPGEPDIQAGRARGSGSVVRSARWFLTELVLGEATVTTHLSNLFAKLGLRDRVEAVIYAYESGLIEPGDA